MNKVMAWYKRTVDGASVNAVATKAGLNQSTLNRQLHAKRLTPETLVAIADAYGKDAIEALLIHGLITRKHIRAHARAAALQDYSDKEIADEVTRRLVGVAVHPVFDAPVDLHVIDREPDFDKMAALDPGYNPEDEMTERHDT